MGRDYSRNACAACKIRRKKCDEAKPICGACVRLQLACEYGGQGDRAVQIRREDTARGTLSPLTVVQSLRSAPSTGAAEESIISRIPASSASFMTPISNRLKLDHRVIWQLMFQDKLVQSALVACFSTLLGTTPGLARTHRVSYGKALRELSLRINAPRLTRDDTLPLVASVGALGLMAASGYSIVVVPSIGTDLLQHWIALMSLMRRMPPLDFAKLSPLEANAFLMILELLAYYNTVAMYSSRPDAFQKLSKEARIVDILDKLNPDRAHRVWNSPLICGQYTMYSLILDVTCLFRRSAVELIETEQLDRMEDSIQSLEVSVSKDFEELPIGGSSLQYHVFAEIYTMVLTSLSICVTALREPCKANLETIHDKASRNLARFSDVPKIPMSWAAVTWPISVLACVLHRDEDLGTLRRHFDSIVFFLDLGHVTRLQALLEKVRQVRQQSMLGDNHPQSSSDAWPIGLSLLRRRNGVLS